MLQKRSFKIKKKYLWPEGLVPYVLNNTMTAQDRSFVAKAMNEYHTKTCIKFIPKRKEHKSYVFIFYDNTARCGKATTGRNGGYQYAKMGGSCRDAKTMAHELG